MNTIKRFPLFILFLFITHVSSATIGEVIYEDNLAYKSSLEVSAPGVVSAIITGPVSFCESPANGFITFEGTGGNAPYTFTYQIDGNPIKTISTIGSSSTVDVPVNTLNDNIFTYRITSVKGATGGAVTVNISAIITVINSPLVDFSFMNNVCSGEDIQFIPTVQGIGNYTYTWNFGDGQTSTDQLPTHNFTSLGCGTFQYTVTLTVTDNNGCSTTKSKLISVYQKPDISFSDEAFPFGDPFNNCGVASAGNPDYTIIVGNTSASSTCISSYSIDWGDGTALVSNAVFPAAHTYKQLGTYYMVIKARGANGCENSISYVVKNITNPSVGITSPGTTTNLCAQTANLKFEIANWGTNSPGTTYTVDYGDGSPIKIYTQEELNGTTYYNKSNPSSSTNFPIPHSYIASNCPNGAYMVKLTATNSCSSTVATVNNITVLNKTAPDFTAPASTCINSNVVFTNTSLPGNNVSCNQSSIYTWDFGDGSPVQTTVPTLPVNANHTYTTSGNYTVTLTTKNICGESTVSRSITVNPLITGTISATGIISGKVTVCRNGISPVITLTGANGTAPYTFTYRINNGPVQTITTTNGSSITITVPTGTTGNFTYTLLSVQGDISGCTQPISGSLVVEVTEPPTGTISGSGTVCLNGTSPQITFTGSGGKAPYTFTYNINGGPVKSIINTGNTATITLPTNVLGDIKVNLLSITDSNDNACTQTVSGSATITVSSPPASMILKDWVYCAGENTPGINFSNTVPGTTYSWTNSNIAIGLAASGTGNIPVFRAKNNTGSPIISVITVTPSISGCDGASQTFTITIYPPVVVVFSPADQTICSGQSTAAVTLTSTSAGAVFSWTATQPAGVTGVATSGTNVIPVQTLTNTTSAPITVTYRATASSPATASCAVFEYSYTITVNPLSVIGQNYSQNICSGSAFSVSPVNGGSNSIPTGTKYTWSAPSIFPAGSISGSSAQNAPQGVISQTLVNNSTATATATYTVTPVANGCTGVSFTVVVNVLPLPTASITGNATACQNGASPSITFTGTNGTPPYIFTYRINGGANKTVTANSGNSTTVAVPTGIAGNFTYTLVSVQEGSASACSQSQAGTVTIIVSPLPTAAISASQNGCLNGSSPQITFTGSKGTPPYTFTYNIDGGAVQTIPTTSGSSVTLDVPTNVLDTYTYNLISVRDASTNACSQAISGSATLSINQLPALMTLNDREYCNGEITSVINFTNAVPGTTYSWTNSNTSIGLAASGVGSIPSFTTKNTTIVPIVSTITVTPSSNGCVGSSQTFKFTVHPSAVVFVPGDQTICSGENTSLVTLTSNISGALLSWYATQPAGITGMVTTGTISIPVQTLINTTNVPITVTYHATATSVVSTACTGIENSYNVTINPKPVIGQTFNPAICSGGTFTVSPTNGPGNSIPAGTKYTWSAPVVNPVGSLTGGSAQNAPQGIMSQMLVNNTSVTATAVYSVIPVANGCQGTPFAVSVTVFPLPKASIAGGATVCQNSGSPFVNFIGTDGIAPYIFSYRINNGSLQTTTTTSGNIASVSAPTGITGKFTYTLVSVQDSRSNACSQAQTGSVTVTVDPIPTAAISGNATVCRDAASPFITFTGSKGTAPYIFSYNINGGAVQSVTTTSGNSFDLAVPTNTAGDYIYNLVSVQDASSNGCSQAVTGSATVTISRPPAPMTLSDQEYCYGVNTSEIIFSNTVGGTTYSWTSSNPAIGLASSGVGSIPAFLTRNPTANSISSTITVTPRANGCDGVSQTFILTVRPAVIIFTPGDQTICSGESTSLVTLGSSTTGAVFSWSATAPAGISGVAAGGTNIIPIQTLINTTNAPIAVTYKAMATSPGIANCEWVVYSYTVTVNPKPVVQETFNQDICSGSYFTVSPQNGAGNSISAGTQYTWNAPVISPAGSLNGGNSQLTPQAVISQTLVNNTLAIARATYTVTPIVNGCPGDPFIININVLPLPTVTTVNDRLLCTNELDAAVVFTGNVPGTVFKWESDNTSIGMSAAGVGNIPQFKAVNSTGMPQTTTIKVTPTLYNGSLSCEGTPMQFAITVNPTGQVNDPGDQNACSGNNLSINFTSNNTGGSTAYEWTNSNPNIGLGASGTGNISFVPVNNGSTELSTSITVTPTFSNNGVSCEGMPETFTIDVYPAVIVDKPLDQVVCNGNKTEDIKFSGNIVNAIYSWTNDNSTIGLPASGTGDILPFTVVNNGSVPVVATITVTPDITGCNDTPNSFKITVNSSPAITEQPLSSTICLGEKPMTLSVLVINGTGMPNYQWYSNTSNSTIGATLILNANSPTYDPPSSGAGTFYYYCVISYPTDDCNLITSDIAQVTIHPNPIISIINQEINSGEVFSVTPSWSNGDIVPLGTTYTWSDPVISPTNSITGTSAQADPQTSISQQLINTTTGTATVTYTVTPTSGTCRGASFQVIVKVKQSVNPQVTIHPTTCYGLNNGSITTDIQGGVPFATGAPYQIIWSGPNGFSSTSANISNLNPGDYLLKITDATGIEFSASYTVTEPEEIMVVTDSRKDITCYGDANGEIAITASGGTGAYLITWTKNNAPFATSDDITGLDAGNYEVTVTDTNNCSPKVIPYIITQPMPLDIQLEEKTDILCFGNSTGAISVSVTGGMPIETAPGVFDYQYAWTGPNGFSSSTRNLSNIPAGNYQLKVTDNSGCEASFSVILSEPLAITASSTTTPISCFGDNDASIKLTISGGTPPYQANWDNYATGTFQDNLSAGDYTIVITDANQCQVTTSVNIPEALAFKITPVIKNVTCNGARDGSIALNFESELSPVVFSWSDNSTSGTTRNNMRPGTYTVNIKGGDFCSISRTFTITEPQPLILSATVTDIMDCSKDNSGAINLMATGGTPPYRYTWSNGAATEDLTDLQAGNYGVTITDSIGCSQVAKYVVNRPAPLEINIHPSIDFDCETKEYIAICKANVSGGVLPYRLKWSVGKVENDHDQTMETNQSGIVFLTVMDSLGCVATHSINLQIPHPGIEYQMADCDSYDFQFTSGLTNSSANTYTWEFGDGTSSNLQNPQHNYPAAGIYKLRLTVVNANLCTVVYDETVNALVPPVVAIDKDPKFCPGDSVLIYGTGATTYRWNDGTTGDSIWISYPGNYSVTGYTDAGCMDSFNFTASYYDLMNYTIHSDYNELTSEQNEIHFWSEDYPFSNYQWDFGDSLQGQGVDIVHAYEISKDGFYDVTLRVVNPNGCLEETTKRIWRSYKGTVNTFTPNGDGINDIYLRGWQIEVFNRNGILMYKGDEGWDGNYHGSPVDNDTYFVIIYDSSKYGAKYKTGYITVLR